MKLTCPVFDSSGHVTELPFSSSGSTLLHPTNVQPTMTYRDRASEMQQNEQIYRAVQRAVNPQLAAALDRLERRQAEARQWTEVCSQQRAEVTRLQTLVQRAQLSASYSDDDGGSRSERLAKAQAVLAESLEELEASLAEVAEADAAAQELVTL